MPAPDPCSTCKWFRPFDVNPDLGECLVYPTLMNSITVQAVREHVDSTNQFDDEDSVEYRKGFHFPIVSAVDFCSLWEKITP